MVVGPSGCGKRVFVIKLLKVPQRYFCDVVPNVDYCYGLWQEGFRPLARMGVHMHKDTPESDQLQRWFSHTRGGVLVLDNLMEEGGNAVRGGVVAVRPRCFDAIPRNSIGHCPRC